MKKMLILCAVITLVAVNVFADMITFKSGKKVEGDITSITNDSVTVNIYGVTEMTYDIGDIQEINGQVVELKPAATAPAAPSETTVNPPAETTQAAPETSTPPAKPVETAPVANELAPGVPAPMTESMGPPPTGEVEEKISGPVAGEVPKIKFSDKEAKAFMGVIMAFLGVILVVFVILYIYSAICLQTIASKTGAENGWMAWIPIANLFLMCNIGYVKYIWLLFILAGFVPIVGTILGPICDLFLGGFLWYRIALARGKQGWIGAITVIPVVGLFTMGYLAFSKKEEEAAPLPDIGGGQPAKPSETTSSFKPPVE